MNMRRTSILKKQIKSIRFKSPGYAAFWRQSWKSYFLKYHKERFYQNKREIRRIRLLETQGRYDEAQREYNKAIRGESLSRPSQYVGRLKPVVECNV